MKPPFTTRAWSIVLPYSSSMMTLAGNVTGIAPTATLRVLPWPIHIPRQIYISSARCGHQTIGAPPGQFAVAIDYGRKAFNAGVPPWYQTKPDGSNTDWTENLTLVSLLSNGPQEARWLLPDPAFFDADKDLLWIQQDAADDQWWAQLGYLTVSTVDVLPYPAPVPPGWNPVAGPISFDNSSPGWGGYTFAVKLDPSALAGIDPGSQCRVTLEGPGLIISKVYINGIQCVADGFGRWVAPTGLDRTNGMLVKAYIATSGILSIRTASVPGWHSSWFQGDDAASQGTAGYTPTNNSWTIGLKLMEEFFP